MKRIEEKINQKVGDRIKKLIKERGPLMGWTSTGEFYKRMQSLYPSSAIVRYSFNRILNNGIKHIQERTIEQFAHTMGIKKSELLRGTKAEIRPRIIATAKEDQEPNFVHAGGAEVRILERNSSFIIEQLTIKSNSYKFLKTEFPEFDNDYKEKIKTLVEGISNAVKDARLKLPGKNDLKGDFNKLDYVLKMRDLHTKFPNLDLPPEAIVLKKKKNLPKIELWKLNRLVLETAFPDLCPKINQDRMRTDPEQDNPSAPESLKWVTVMIGKINLIITNNGVETKKALTEGQGYSFDARQLHCFENISPRPSKVLIVHSPAANSVY